MVRCSLNIKTVVYMLFGKNKIIFGQKFFASPKLGTPVHLWLGSPAPDKFVP